MSWSLIPGTHTNLTRPSKTLLSEGHTLLDLSRYLTILSFPHSLFSITAPPVGLTILPGFHTFFKNHSKYLWSSRFAVSIRGCINRDGWKKGGKTLAWQFHHNKNDFINYFADYSYCVFSPVFQNYTNKLVQAMQAWNALPEEEKHKWRKKARGRPLYGSNLFVRWWFKNH